jgi:hypothetical protein
MEWATYQSRFAPFYADEQYVEAAFCMTSIDKGSMDHARLRPRNGKRRERESILSRLPFFVYLGRWSRFDDFSFTTQTISAAVPYREPDPEPDDECFFVYIEGQSESEQ